MKSWSELEGTRMLDLVWAVILALLTALAELFSRWLCGLMDKASDFGSEDCRFESCHSRKGMGCFLRASWVAQAVKNPPTMQEPQEKQVRSLGYPLEQEMVTHSSILAWRIPWTEEPGGLLSTESQRIIHEEMT